MIPFDRNQISFKYVMLKTVTTVLGGSLTYADPSDTSDKEHYIRSRVPMSVARQFIKRTKMTKYLKTVPVCLMMYNDRIVDMDRHPLSCMGSLQETMADGTVRKWRSGMETAWAKASTQLESLQWWFDGRYIYTVNGMSVDQAVEQGVHMTRDGKFRSILVDAIDCQSMSITSDVQGIKPRACVAYVSDTGAYSMSPPIWKQMTSIGAGTTTSDDDDDGDEGSTTRVDAGSFMFDNIDSQMAVNVDFALRAGSVLGHEFGYECVQPLGLPQLMVDLRTVNLPSLDRDIRRTHEIQLRFTHAMAWLLGINQRVNDLNTSLMLRSLMKYLTTRGIFARHKITAASIFKEGMSESDVTVKTVAELTNDAVILQSTSDMVAAIHQRRRRKAPDQVMSVGTLLNDD